MKQGCDLKVSLFFWMFVVELLEGFLDIFDIVILFSVLLIFELRDFLNLYYFG